MVEELLQQAAESEVPIFMSEVNHAETKYIILRKDGRDLWTRIESRLPMLSLVTLPVTRSQADQAAEYKAAHRMSLADAFAAALAKERDATLVTGDAEFKPLAKEIRIKWLKG